MRFVLLGIFPFVLSVVLAYPQAMAQNSSATRDINAVLAAHDLAIPDVVGVYVGTIGNERQPCLKVMLARANPESERKIPPMIEGYPVITEVTVEIEARGAFGSGQKRGRVALKRKNAVFCNSDWMTARPIPPSLRSAIWSYSDRGLPV